MTATLFSFSSMDSLFFRDGRPMNAGESAWVDSLFPPSGQTIQGAIRAAILDYLDADIKKFQAGECCLPDGGSLKKEIGDAGSLGNLSLSGPFLCRAGTLFFPAPLDLAKNRQGTFGLPAPSKEPIRSDLGTICFPCISGSGYKTMPDCWISRQELNILLQGGTDGLEPLPLIAELPDQPGLADREPKTGLARDNQVRRHIDGMLFAIAPVRPRTGVDIVVGVTGVPDTHYPASSFLQKFGGEGKIAHVSAGGKLDLPGPYIYEDHDGLLRFKIVFITPTLLEPDQLLPVQKTGQGAEDQSNCPYLWQGNFAGCHLRVLSGCVGKPARIGGWDMKNWRPKPLQSFIPAGSVFFCEAEADQKEAVHNLHNTKTGRDTEYGYGHILIGKWNYTGAQS